MRLLIVLVWVAVGVRASVFIDAAIKELKESVKDDSDRRFLSLADDDKEHSNICRRFISVPYKLQASGKSKVVDLLLFELLKSVYFQGLTDTNPRREDVEKSFFDIVESIQGLESNAGQQPALTDQNCGLDIAGPTKKLFGGVMKLFGEVNGMLVDGLITYAENKKKETKETEKCKQKYYDQLIAELQAFQPRAKDIDKSAQEFLQSTSKAFLLLKLLYLNIADRYLKGNDADAEQLKHRFVLLYDSLYISKRLFNNESKSIFEKPREKYHRGLAEEFSNTNPNVSLNSIEIKLEELMAETLGISLVNPLLDSQDDKRSIIINKIYVGLGFNNNSYLV